MRAFQIPAGTLAQAIEPDADWTPANIETIITKADQLFFTEDIVVDPLGHVGTGPDSVTVGGLYAQQGFYAFREGAAALGTNVDAHRQDRTRWTLLVAADKVVVV